MKVKAYRFLRLKDKINVASWQKGAGEGSWSKVILTFKILYFFPQSSQITTPHQKLKKQKVSFSCRYVKGECISREVKNTNILK